MIKLRKGNLKEISQFLKEISSKIRIEKGFFVFQNGSTEYATLIGHWKDQAQEIMHFIIYLPFLLHDSTIDILQFFILIVIVCLS